MTSNDKKIELLKNRIQSDLKVESENVDDLLNFIQELLKKGSKERLLSELKEIYEEIANVDSFVEWVWGVYGPPKKPENVEKKNISNKEKQNEPKQPSQALGFSKLATRAFDDVKARDKANSSNQEKRPPRFQPANKFKTNQGINGNSEDNEGKLRSSGGDSKPIIKLKGAQEPQKFPEEHKTGSILDRLVKPSDKLKRQNPVLKEEAKKENKFEKIEKKVKPGPVQTLPKPASKKIKTAAEVRAEEEARARAQNQAQSKPQEQKQTMHEEKSIVQSQASDLSKTEAPTKLKIRCRNWPLCKNEHCLYHHPTENCKHFPNCTYGDNCLYIHPAIPCKFGEYCQRPNCAYVHPRMSASMNYYGFGHQPQKKPFLGHRLRANPKPGVQNMASEIPHEDFDQNDTGDNFNETTQ